MRYELFTTFCADGGGGGDKMSSLEIFDDVLFTCHASTTHDILQKQESSHVDAELLNLLGKIQGYDYICTHIDDFKVIAKDPSIWIDFLHLCFLLNKTAHRIIT